MAEYNVNKITISKSGNNYTLTDTDTKNTAGATSIVSTKLFLVGAQAQGDNPQTYTDPRFYIGADGVLYANNTPVLTSHQDLSSITTNITNLQQNKIVGPTVPIDIPSSGNTVTKYIAGLTADHELLRWNFSSSPENNPPVNLRWTTANGYFIIENLGGSTSETIQPVFGLVYHKVATNS